MSNALWNKSIVMVYVSTDDFCYGFGLCNDYQTYFDDKQMLSESTQNQIIEMLHEWPIQKTWILGHEKDMQFISKFQQKWTFWKLLTFD